MFIAIYCPHVIKCLMEICCNSPIANKRSGYHDFTINYSICGVSFSLKEASL